MDRILDTIPLRGIIGMAGPDNRSVANREGREGQG